MTDDLELALVNAGLDLLRADVRLTVYDGAVPNTPSPPEPPYVLVYTIVNWVADDEPVGTLDGITRRALVRWICHCVGANQQASREVSNLVRAALLDVRPAVAGMQPGLIRNEQDEPPVRNEQTGSLRFDSVHVYRLYAVI